MLVEKFMIFLEELRKDKEIITWNESDAGIGIFGNIPEDKLEEFLRVLIMEKSKTRRVAGHGDKPDTPRPKPAPRPLKR